MACLPEFAQKKESSALHLILIQRGRSVTQLFRGPLTNWKGFQLLNSLQKGKALNYLSTIAFGAMTATLTLFSSESQTGRYTSTLINDTF